MAVISKIPGLKVEIYVDQVPLKEYDPDGHQWADACNRYIEAQSDKEFALSVTWDATFPRTYAVETMLEIDESFRRTYLTRPDELFRPGFLFKNHSKSRINGMWYKQSFRFAAIDIIGDHVRGWELDAMKDAVEEKGNIRISFRFVSHVEMTQESRTRDHKVCLDKLPSIPENACKGSTKTHQITLGAPRPMVYRGNRPSMKWFHLDSIPFATFNFHYRSMSALKAMRIVPDQPQHDAHPMRMPPHLGWNFPMQHNFPIRTKKQEIAPPQVLKRSRPESPGDANDDDDVVFLYSRPVKRARGDAEVVELD